MKILVTGGAGFIASHIVDAYISKGHQVAVVDDLSSGIRCQIHRQAKFYQVDICEDELKAVFHDFKPDFVNHHAAQISVSESIQNPRSDASINVIGLVNVMECAAHSGVKKIIFASSGGAVYGHTEMPASESSLPQMNSPYGVTKITGENYCQFYSRHYGVDFTIFRYSNVYGPRQTAHGEAGAVALFCKQLLSGEQPVIFGASELGDGGGIRDYVFVEDIVEANLKALEEGSREILNISTGIGTTTEDLFKMVAENIKINIKPKLGPPRIGDIKQSIIDPSRAGAVLGWLPQTLLNVGLKKTVEFYQEQCG